MDVDQAELHLREIFTPYAARKYNEMRARSGRFVHYTSAEVAVSIIKNKEVWMRKSSTMNDFMEIQHGLKCLSTAYTADIGSRFKDLLERLHPGFCKDLEKQFDAWIPSFQHHTFLTCVSEHLDGEDRIGRLSMWRAYGGTTGVAIVMNNGPFLRDSDALSAYTSPVGYFSVDQFKREFDHTVDGMHANEELLRSLDRDELMDRVFHMFQYAVLSTKHPGFHEEREWRIIHSPMIDPSRNLVRDIAVVRGSPQPIFKIPLQNFPGEGFTGATVPELLDRIIIGPTVHPLPTYEAFVTLLEQAGVPDAAEKVFISDIPLRQ